MAFKPGQNGGARGKSRKTVFNVVDCLKKRYPDRLPQLEAMLVAVSHSPASNGKTQYLRYLRGEYLTPRQSGIANCFDCCGRYADGKKDCENPMCPEYPYMPYRLKP